MQALALNIDLDPGTFLRQVLGDTLSGNGLRLQPEIQEYIVGLLEDSARGVGPVREALSAPLALQLAAALNAPACVRFSKLRQLGDGVLLLGGLYEPHLKRTGLPDGYVITLGQRAYAAASNVMSVSRASEVGQGPIDLLSQLAEGFERFVALLRDVSDTLVACAAHSPRELTRLWERWTEKRTDHLERLLAGRGIPAHALSGGRN